MSADAAAKVRELLEAVLQAERLLAAGDRDEAGALLVRTLERFGQACEKHDTRGHRCAECVADEDAEREQRCEFQDNGDGTLREGWPA